MLCKHLRELLVIQLIFIISTSSLNCLTDDGGYKCKLGSKTPYRFIANHDDLQLNYSGCAERKIWLLIRHGTRYPGEKYLPSMLEKLPVLRESILSSFEANRSSLLPKNVDSFARWKVDLDESKLMKLAEEGENEMIDLAERFQSRFPELMAEVECINCTYKFKYTATQRAEQSARSFALGLFGHYKSKNVWFPPPEHRDPILRFYKRCPRWRVEVDKNPVTYEEKLKFVNSSIMENVLAEIGEKLGFKIDYATAHLMYSMCAFETAWYRDVESPWCGVFSLEHFKVLEFAEDLEYYWVDGYGYRLTYEQACPALNDAFDFFDSDKGEIVTAYFTHSGTVLKLLALLGVAKDPHPLKHDSFTSHQHARAWRVSLIDAFASNIAFVLYDCDAQGPSILAMHQERVIHLPGCPADMPCPFTIMKEMYPDNDNECQFDTMCNLS